MHKKELDKGPSGEYNVRCLINHKEETSHMEQSVSILARKLTENISKVIIGKDDVIRKVIISLL